MFSNKFWNCWTVVIVLWAAFLAVFVDPLAALAFLFGVVVLFWVLSHG